MNNIEVLDSNKKYFLNNNSDKYDRIFNPKFNPEFVKDTQLTSEQILTYYDKFGGLILNENRQKIVNGQFWKKYNKKLAKQCQQEKKWGKKKKIVSSFIEFVRGFKEVLWLIILIIFLIAIFFRHERTISIIKEIKDLF